MYRFFETQRKNRTKNDWVTTILRDLEELKLNLNFDEIKAMKKSDHSPLLKCATLKDQIPCGTHYSDKKIPKGNHLVIIDETEY